MKHLQEMPVVIVDYTLYQNYKLIPLKTAQPLKLIGRHVRVDEGNEPMKYEVRIVVIV